MTRTTRRKAGLLAFAATLMPLVASAHSGAPLGLEGAGAGFLAGLMHPLSGADHLAAMLAVGCWSALTERRAWLAPLAFAAMLLAGAVAGLAGLELAGGEPAIVASLLVLGLLVAMRQPLPATAALVLVAGFALFHGLAHGHELAGADTAWAPLAGMMAATVGLHLAGILLGRRLQRSGRGPTRAAGGAVLLLGLTLLAKLVHA